MKFIERLDRIFRPIAIPNVTAVLIACQAVFFVLSSLNPAITNIAVLSARRVLQGELWRLGSFVVVPPTRNMIFILFAWYLFYLMGSALESYWGTVRYNVFLWVGAILTIAVAFITPDETMPNYFLAGAVFLAFATYYPDFELLVFFILPVKIKWLALFAWLGFAGQFLFGTNGDRLAVVASVGNYVLFFGPYIYDRLINKQRRRAWQAKQRVNAKAPRHTCGTCGITNLSHPTMDFRYCSTCDGCFCSEHLRNHEHAEVPAKPDA